MATPGRYELLITGGVVVSADSQANRNLAIRDGRIAAVLGGDEHVAADRVIDASGCFVMPGGIDTHTHARWPYGDLRTDDGFFGAGRSAAFGGTTTMVDFVPQLDPGQRLMDATRDRIAEVERDAPIDVALHSILNRSDDDTLGSIGAVIDAGLTSFKMYTTYDDKRVDDGQIWLLMQEIVRHGGLPGFHAENHDIIERSTEQSVGLGHTQVPFFAETRPGLAEAAAIETVALMGRSLGSPVYIFHVSGIEALDAVRRGSAGGGHVFAETCTHYLCLNDEVFSRPDAWKFVITPPIRSAADQDMLWAGIADGTVISVGSDHCAYPLEAKSAHTHDHRLVPPGAAGIEHRTPMLWDEAINRRGLTPSEFVDISATRAAKALGMYPRKGSVEVGADADLVILDPEAEWTADLFPPATEHTFSLYEHHNGRGVPKTVLSRGVPVIDDGDFVGAPGRGQFVPRARRTSVHPAAATAG